MINEFLRPCFQRFSDNLCGMFFRFMKVVPAKHVVEQALTGVHKRRSDVTPSHYVSGPHDRVKFVIETTSGTAGLGLAYACKAAGVPLILVGDSAIEPALLALLEALGAEVHLVGPGQISEAGGIQNARLKLLSSILADRLGGYWTKQYANDEWALAYFQPAADLIEEFGWVDVFVCPVGSGASSAGFIGGIRLLSPKCALVGVDAIGSVSFDAPEAPRRLRGVGMSIRAKNLRREYFDAVHWVSAEFAWTQAHRLVHEHAVAAGPTTGAAFAVAQLIASQHRNLQVAFLGPDDSKRYEPKIFSENLLREDNLWLPSLPQAPVAVPDPTQVSPDAHWFSMAWNHTP